MIIISHRGNLEGKNVETENDPYQILKVLSLNIDCEIDVWNIDNNFYLGHDKPIHSIKKKFLETSGLWCHAKNLNALYSMLENKNIHCFWHEKDSFTITSRGYIWTYPNKPTTKNSIIVSNNKKNKPNNCFGICTDYALFYLNK